MKPRITNTCIVCGEPMGDKPKFVSNWSLCSDTCRKERRTQQFGGRKSTESQWKHQGIITETGEPPTDLFFQELLAKQNGTCALCSSTDRLCLDHDHETGYVRGILCHTHNLGLGKLGDSIQSIDKVSQYLRTHQRINPQKTAGIDYSMTCPAICIHEGSSFSYSNCTFYYYNAKQKDTDLKIYGTTPEDYDCEERRFQNIALWAYSKVKDCSVIFIEDYAMAAKGRVFSIGENTGLLKWLLWKEGKPFKLVAPTVVKKFGSGRGNASKNEMYEAFVKETGVELMPIYQPRAEEVGSPVGDLVDSYFLCKYGVFKGSEA